MNKLEDYKVGDVLKFTDVTKCGTEFRTGIVVRLNHNNLGLVGVQGIEYLDNVLPTGQFSFNPEDVGKHKYGFVVDVEKIGFKRSYPHSFQGPKPGDRAYDLMC